MSQQISPFLEGKYGWNYGESGWNIGADENWLKFSYLHDGNVDSIVASLPAASNGAAHFLTTDNRFYFAVGTTWYSSPCPKWFIFKIKSTGVFWQFDGTNIVEISNPTQANAALEALQDVVDGLGSAAFEDVEFFATQAALDIASAQANEYTDTLRADLITNNDALKGAGQVGWYDQLFPTAYLKTVSDMKNGEPVSLFRVIPKAQHAAILDYTSSYDCTSAFQAAVDSGYRIDVPRGNYYISSTVNIVADGFTMSGAGIGGGLVSSNDRQFTRIWTDQDIILFSCNGNIWNPKFEDIFFDVSVSHSNPHIRFGGCFRGTVDACLISGFGGDNIAGSGVLYDDGAGGIGGSMGQITRTIFNHASIDVKTWDVHINDSWVWANSKPWAIRAVGSVGNLMVANTDIVPPLSSVVGKKAGIYLSGAVTQPKLTNIYGDGNPVLVTGPVVLAEDGVIGLQIIGGHSNQCDEAVIILDSIIAPVVKGHTFFENNISNASNAPDILLRETFAQPLEKPLIEGNSHIISSARTTQSPAISVDAGTSRISMRIKDNSFHQPGAGGSYTDTEIYLADGPLASLSEGSLSGNAGTRSVYAVSGSTAFAATDTVAVFNFSVPLAYMPREDQVRVVFEGEALAFRVLVVSTSQIQIYFATAAAGGGTCHLSVDL